MSVVIDASVSLSWCFEDESTPLTKAIEERVRQGGAFVPAIWSLEVGNILLQAEKRGRISAADASARMEIIRIFPIAVDPMTIDHCWRVVAPLARSQKLTTYDAAYLELAMRRGLPLATLDKALRAAADRLGVRAIP